MDPVLSAIAIVILAIFILFILFSSYVSVGGDEIALLERRWFGAQE